MVLTGTGHPWDDASSKSPTATPKGPKVNILHPAASKALDRVVRENRDAFRCNRCETGPRCERCEFRLDVELPMDVADMMEDLYG